MGDQDYLVHYGVLGMKWGMHRAAKKGTTYSYKSRRTKNLEKGLSKAKEKHAKKGTEKTKANVSKMSNYLKTSKKTDSARLSYAKKTSVGKGIAQQILFGPIGARTYQSMRATGKGQSDALLTQAGAMILDIAFPARLGTVYNLKAQADTELGNTQKKKKKKSK